MPQEIEIKLAIDPRDVSRLRNSAILRASNGAHAHRTRLISTYYDTRSSSLQRGAIVLRVRKNGRKRVQSVKLNASGPGSITRRIEFESPIGSDRPNLMRVEDPGIRRLIQRRLGNENLIPVFATDVARETWQLRLGRSHIECVIDFGCVVANGKRMPISEVELELKSGDPARLFQLAHRLNAIVPLRIKPRSKTERGYDLANGATLAAAGATPIHLDADRSVRDSFAIIAQACLTEILTNVNHAYQGNDPEGVHQLRVSIRHMRSAYSLFRNAKVKAGRFAIADELRALQRKLGATREWDVLIDETFSFMPKKLRRSASNLIKIAEMKRAEGHQSVHDMLRDPRYTDLLLRLAFWLEQQFGLAAAHRRERQWKVNVLAKPIKGVASEVLSVRHAKVLKLGKRLRELDVDELHRLRIRIKKLRYMTEFFSDIWPGRRTDRYLFALKKLQGVLGTLHDTIVALNLVAELAASGGSNAAGAADHVNRWLVESQQCHRTRAIARWRKFAKRRLFWESK